MRRKDFYETFTKTACESQASTTTTADAVAIPRPDASTTTTTAARTYLGRNSACGQLSVVSGSSYWSITRTGG